MGLNVCVSALAQARLAFLSVFGSDPVPQLRRHDLSDVNIFDVSLLKESYFKFVDFVTNSPKLAGKADLSDNLRLLKRKIIRAIQRQSLSYSTYLSWVAHLAADLSDPGQEKLQLEALEKISLRLSEGVILLPVFDEKPLSRRELMSFVVQGIHPIQLVTESCFADGSLMTPIQFLIHDIAHAYVVISEFIDGKYDSNRMVLEKLLTLAVRNVRHQALNHFLKELDRSSLSDRAKLTVENILYEVIHEGMGYFMGTSKAPFQKTYFWELFKPGESYNNFHDVMVERAFDENDQSPDKAELVHEAFGWIVANFPYYFR